MRKLNHTVIDQNRVTALASAGHSSSARSWMPAAQFAVPALDPAHWSQRKSQANWWRLLERLERLKTIH